MSVLVYVDLKELPGMEVVTKAVEKAFPDVKWKITSDADEFDADLRSFKILADPERNIATGDRRDWDGSLDADLHWPAPSKFLKNQALKEQVWEDIKTKVVPASKKQTVVSSIWMPITDGQVSQILAMISGAKTPFVVESQNGERVGVGKDLDFVDDNIDVCVTLEDVASMLAASLVFKAQQVVLRPARSKSQGREGAIK